MAKFLYKKLLFKVRVYELLLILLFYFLYALLYYFGLSSAIDVKYHGIIWVIIFDLSLNFLNKAIITIPFWWFFFRKMANERISRVLMFHLLCLPLFVWLSKMMEHYITEFFLQKEKGYLQAWFDYYMPALFYLIQFGLMHAYNFWLRSQRQLKTQKELMELAYQSEINALKAQIQPHFLFNTLNSISATVNPEQEKTRVLIAKLADTFRYALRSSREDLVLLSDELAFVKTYLELEKERFRNRLNISIVLDDRISNSLIPPMLLQPLVENAIVHGISPSVKGGSVSIICKKKFQKIQISIADTGLGYAGDPSELTAVSRGVGLKNTAMRLEKTFNEPIKIEKNDPAGLKLTFEIPIINDDNKEDLNNRR